MYSAAIYTNFEGERAPKKCDFLSKFFKKCLKTAFLTCFFKNLPAAQKTWPKQGPFSALEELENQFGRAKKKVIKIFENFLKIRPPPLEKILDPPLYLERKLCLTSI